MVTDDLRISGRIRAAGCHLNEESAIEPEEQVLPASKDSIVPILANTIARRRQWSARSLKLAIRSAMECHRIDGHAVAAALDMHVSAFSRAVTLELDTLNASHLAVRLGLAVRGPPEMPVFVRESA